MGFSWISLIRLKCFFEARRESIAEAEMQELDPGSLWPTFLFRIVTNFQISTVGQIWFVWRSNKSSESALRDICPSEDYPKESEVFLKCIWIIGVLAFPSIDFAAGLTSDTNNRYHTLRNQVPTWCKHIADNTLGFWSSYPIEVSLITFDNQSFCNVVVILSWDGGVQSQSRSVLTSTELWL